MEYVCVDARFKFYNGKKTFTVSYIYGIQIWLVFKDEETGGALWKKKINPSKSKNPNREEAKYILEEYLETVTVP